MNYHQVELFNVEEVVDIPGRDGVLLQRVPESVRCQLREQTQAVYRKASCCELRFVSDWKPVQVTLASHNGNSAVTEYFGDYFVKQHVLTSEPTVISMALPSPGFLPQLDSARMRYSFAPQVWRLVFHGGEVHVLDIEGESLRPPVREELPSLRYLAYGTSITQGIAATNSDLTYVKQTARRLGADVLNLGASGTAFCEPELADYIASRDDWDFASLCVSVNMLNQGVSREQFHERAAYMIERIAGQHPGKPLFCIGLFPMFQDLGLRWPDRTPPLSTPAEYRETLKAIVESHGTGQIRYIDGTQLLSGFHGLTHDLLHPGDHGMIEIGEKLAAFMKPVVGLA